MICLRNFGLLAVIASLSSIIATPIVVNVPIDTSEALTKREDAPAAPANDKSPSMMWKVVQTPKAEGEDKKDPYAYWTSKTSDGETEVHYIDVPNDMMDTIKAASAEVKN